MSKTFALMLLATSLVAAPAWAAQEPKAVKQDPRIQIVPYDENNPVKLHLVAGHTAVIEVTDKERVTDVFLSDGAHLKKSISGHFVFLKPIMEMPAQPIFIKTARLDGTGDRLYPFMLDAYDPDPPAGLPRANGQVAAVSIASAKDGDTAVEARPYTVRFVYPADEAKARAAAAAGAAKHRAARRDVKLAAARLRAPSPTVISVGYQAQGTAEERAALTPDATWDDGQSTYFRFDGNRRLPVPYVLMPDGEEAVVDYTVQDRTLIIHKTAARFRLRDGDLILCITNPNHSAAGFNPGTGTASPDVVREMKAASR
jgi:type IV secretion system protein VirB9